MQARMGEPERRMTARQTARFTAVVAVLAIFFDAAVGHGLMWENDPYWTYWITKTFLIATVFGLGTAWFGLGAGRGAIITAVHTIILTVYYWTFSPVGLPSSPEWLDLEHTWITGLPIHFGVIYLGYLTALWLWRRRTRQAEEAAAEVGTAAVIAGVVITIVAGGLSTLALGDFPGFTWFLVRILLTVPYLLWWWAWAGRDQVSAVAGGVVLALVWATYAHFLGPVGLPDTPLRLLNAPPPPATVEWLDYGQLWLVSFPIYAASMVVVLLTDAMRSQRQAIGGPVVAAVILGAVLPLMGARASEQNLSQDGTRASIEASGPVRVETGPFYGNAFQPATGRISVEAEDMGGRVTPLPPHDRLTVSSIVAFGGVSYEVAVEEPLVSHPMGEHTTWWGVGLDVSHHGLSGIGTGRLPGIESSVAAFGMGEISIDGRTVATGVPVHVMTADAGLPAGASLELDVGTEEIAVAGLPAGHLRVLWSDHSEVVEDPANARYAIGGVVLVALLAAALLLGRRELTLSTRREERRG
jgi:hypothetical protein